MMGFDRSDQLPPDADAEVQRPAAKRARFGRSSVFTAFNGAGETVYLALSANGSAPRVRPRHGEMLSTPIHQLRAHIEAEERLADAARPLSQGLADGAPTPTRSPAAGAGSPQAPSADLWASKYAPRKFTQLVSDESVNREVLRWLKSWHGTVWTLGGT